MTGSQAADRLEPDLLFGVLAVQAGLLDLARLSEVWVAGRDDRRGSLADLLVQRGWLTPEDAGLVERLRERVQARHGITAGASVVVLAGEEVREWLASLPGRGQSLPDVTPMPLPQGSGDLPTLVRETFPATAPSPTPSGPRYTRTRLHATGGLGRVWVARDEHLGRDVALKELRPEAADNASLGRRFLDEARVTGQLEHPGIVPVYDLDQPADGPACYAMRFIKGATLSDAVQVFHRDRQVGTAGPLELRRLLDAFVAVCNTLAYAHSHGVLHRDLKGLNVVLGDFGEVIVLDWGLAKRVGAEEPDGLATKLPSAQYSALNTQPGQVLGTPAYMAPEQAEGRTDALDARTDVYGLGAVLYEILTGRPPFTGKDVEDLLERVIKAEPLAPRGVWRGAPAALEAVCLKALAKRPADRYPDAAELGREVQRWLADEPVRAYPEAITTRAARWGRRNRPLVTAAVALLVAAVVGLSLTTALVAREQAQTQQALIRVTQEQDRTRQEHARASAHFRLALTTVNRYCTHVSEEQLLAEPGLQWLRKALLADALQFYQELERDPEADPETEAEVARTARRLADLTEVLAPGAEGPGLYRQVIDRLTRLAEAHPDEPSFLVELAEAWNRLGGDLQVRDDRSGAEAAYVQARDLGQRLAQEHPETGDYLRVLGRVFHNLGHLRQLAGNLDEAEAEYAEALAMREGFARVHPRDPTTQAERAQTLVNLAALCRAQGDSSRAERLYRQAIDTLRLLAGRLAFASDLAAALNNLGELYRTTGRPSDAEPAYAEAVTLFDRLSRENPDVVRFRSDAATCRYNLGLVFTARGQPAKAETAYREAAELLGTLPRDFPQVPEFARNLAATCLRLAIASDRAGKQAEALPWYDRAIDALGPLAEGGKDAQVRSLFRTTLVQRALDRTAVGRHADALADWDRIVALDGERTPKEFLFGRVAARARVGEHARAAAEGEELARGPTVAGNWYDLACVYAICSDAVRKDEKLKATEQDELAEKYALRAVEVLEKAETLGYFKAKANRAQFRTEPDLEPIRKHPAFAEFLKKLPADARP